MIQPLRVVMAVLAASFGLLMVTSLPAAAASEGQSGGRSAYVFFDAGTDNSTMSGSGEDMRRARSLRSGREGLLYIRRDGAAYVIRDAATLRQAEAIFRPQQELGARQGELGSQQGALGERQARLGLEQAKLGLQQAEASPGRAAELGRQQAALGRQQDALGREQAALGQRQSELGREQARLARLADARIRDLLAEAIRRGVARRVD